MNGTSTGWRPAPPISQQIAGAVIVDGSDRAQCLARICLGGKADEIGMVEIIGFGFGKQATQHCEFDAIECLGGNTIVYSRDLHHQHVSRLAGGLSGRGQLKLPAVRTLQRTVIERRLWSLGEAF